MTKTELFIDMVTQFVNTLYNPAETIRVIECSPMNKDVLMGDVRPLAEELKIPTKATFNHNDVTEDDYIVIEFAYKGVRFHSYHSCDEN